MFVMSVISFEVVSIPLNAIWASDSHSPVIVGSAKIMKLSNFITCPRTSKWSKFTCPTKIHLTEN